MDASCSKSAVNSRFESNSKDACISRVASNSRAVREIICGREAYPTARTQAAGYSATAGNSARAGMSASVGTPEHQ